jgi:hypothetical protein
MSMRGVRVCANNRFRNNRRYERKAKRSSNALELAKI